jgi:hypothetical protein
MRRSARLTAANATTTSSDERTVMFVGEITRDGAAAEVGLSFEFTAIPPVPSENVRREGART